MALKESPITHILLADDDEDDRELFTDALRELYSRVKLTTAKNGVDLMRLLETWKGALPDVIFLDLNMPLKNGFECLDEIKAEHRLKELPVVILSTSSQKETMDILSKKQASMYIKKPGTYPELKTAIEQTLNVHLRDLASRKADQDFIVIH
ncbi:MAG TPA: response regulator [Chryseosolibacter sp.]